MLLDGYIILCTDSLCDVGLLGGGNLDSRSREGQYVVYCSLPSVLHIVALIRSAPTCNIILLFPAPNITMLKMSVSTLYPCHQALNRCFSQTGVC